MCPLSKEQNYVNTNTKSGKVEVYYNAMNKQLLGYKEQNKQFVLHSETDKKLILN